MYLELISGMLLTYRRAMNLKIWREFWREFGEKKEIMRKIKLYAITENYQTLNDCLNHIITVVVNRKQVEEYLYTRIFLENSTHFKSWCELQEKDAKDKNVFYEYLVKRYGNNDPYAKFRIIKLRYTKNMLCSLLRMLSNATPVGASYETLEEQTTFLNKFAKEKDKKDC